MNNQTMYLDKATATFWYKYSVTYAYDDCEFSFDLWAKSDEDCYSRLSAITDTAKVDRVYMEVGV